MITFKCLGTGSSGNCYVLDDGTDIILLDCGITIKDIKVGIDFDISRLKAVFVTHHHRDHALSVKDLVNMGKKVYTPYESPVGKMINVGGFAVQPFELVDNFGHPTHTNGDGSSCKIFGYLISHPDLGRLLYITDTQYCRYRFSNINHLLLGVNYSAANIETSEDESKKYHVYNGHMELETAKSFVSSLVECNNMTNIILCHLSESNSDKEKFVRTIMEVTTGENVIVARKGLKI